MKNRKLHLPFLMRFRAGVLALSPIAVALVLSSCDQKEKNNEASMSKVESPAQASPMLNQEKLANEIIANTERIFTCLSPVNDSESAQVAVVEIQNSEKRLVEAYDELRELEALPPEQSAMIRKEFVRSFARMGALQKEANLVIRSLDPETSKTLTDAIVGTSAVFTNNAEILRRHGFIE